MKLKIVDLTKTEVGNIEMPYQFNEEIRPDLIKRAVHSIESHERQAYGADPMAGKRNSVENSKRRRHYRGTYGKGISRVPRKIMQRRGTQINFVAAFAPCNVGGRRAHPPKVFKDWDLKINDKERKKAIRSALAATVSKETVINRGHNVPEVYPFVVSSKIESIAKTKDLKNTLMKLGFQKELERTEERTIRAGKGKSRGRKYKTKTGLLIVLSSMCSAFNAAKNIPGVDAVVVNRINAKILAPGAVPGRITLYTDAAIEKIKNDCLFFESINKAKKEKKETKKEKAPAKKAKNE